MAGKFTKRAVILLSALAVIEVSPLPILTSEASAQNLLQVIFGGQNNRKQAEERRRRELELLKAQQIKKKPPRISGPTYKKYRADKLVTVNLSQLVDPVTTSSTSPENLETPAASETVEPFTIGSIAFDSMNLKALPEVAKVLVAHYTASPKYRWVSENGPNDQAKALLKVLQNSDSVGLPSDNYAVELPNITSASTDEDNWKELMRFEMELSTAILTYALDANRGIIDPNRISGYHDFKRKTPDLDKLLVQLTYANAPGDVLKSFNPAGDHFQALHQELAELSKAEEKERITIAEGTFLKPGRSSPELRNIVASIRLKGSEELKSQYAFELNTYRGGEEYTPELVTLVKAFQKENNLADDGIIGKKTIRAMVEDSNAVKIDKLRYAMERSRWLPSKLAAKRVFINQPAYKVTYFEDNNPNLTMRVVVGKRSNQTYFFDDEIEKVEFNPYWGVPQSIITNEMLPKLRSDPTYLDRLGYEVSYKGRRTSSGSIDWLSLGSTKAVGVRQPPSSKNALGQLKILFPNAHAIYMHDTPAKKLFGRDTRAFSHGCVRLQHPKEMAAAVLGTSLDEINSHIAPRKNKTVYVDKPIPVHVSYFTAWPNATGDIEYFADVYNRDKALAKAIATTQKARMAARS